MTEDRRTKSVPRYSRYSRSAYDGAPPASTPAEDVSLAELTAQSLNGHRQPPPPPPPPQYGRPANRFGPEPGHDQPPPPEPSAFWQDEARRQQREPAPQHPALHETAIVDAEYTEVQASRSVRPPREEAPKIGKRAEKAVSQGLSVLAKTGTAMRDKAGPALTNAGLWLANNLRRREIRKRYNRALVFTHTRILDRNLEPLFFVPTRKGELLDPAPEQAIHYDGPVPSAVFNWVMALMPADLRQFAFVDIRAGRGRSTLMATKWQFDRVLAFEYDDDLFDDLQMNVAQYPRSRMTCRNVDCHRGDVEGISLPDQPCIIWFSGAWREKMIDGVMDYVRNTYRQSPRRIYIVLENVADDTVITQDTIFDPIEPPVLERLKLRLLSPMDFKVYRSLY